MFFCHCSRCSKETGTIHGANVFFNDAQLVWEKGENNIAYFKLKGTSNVLFVRTAVVLCLEKKVKAT